MKSPWQILMALVVGFALLALAAYFFASPSTSNTEKEANRFFAVASQGTHLLDALREAPHFHGVYFGDCAHIEKSGTSGDPQPFVFVPKVGERVKFASVQQAMAQNPAMLRDYPACRQASVVFMEIFPYRGVVGVELDERGNIRRARDPIFSN